MQMFVNAKRRNMPIIARVQRLRKTKEITHPTARTLSEDSLKRRVWGGSVSMQSRGKKYFIYAIRLIKTFTLLSAIYNEQYFYQINIFEGCFNHNRQPQIMLKNGKTNNKYLRKENYCSTLIGLLFSCKLLSIQLLKDIIMQ